MSTRHERAADKGLNEKHTKILTEMLQRPENKRCVDCRKKDPRWVSWNLGVFMCIRCSGIHRSMGTHISKVKSVDLDSWTPEQIANVVRWGNATANKYWEANLTSEPTESSIDQWVRAKYDRKQFAMKGPMPEPEVLSGGNTSQQQQINAQQSQQHSQSNQQQQQHQNQQKSQQQQFQPGNQQSEQQQQYQNQNQQRPEQQTDFFSGPAKARMSVSGASQQPLGAEMFSISKPPSSNNSIKIPMLPPPSSNPYQYQQQTQAPSAAPPAANNMKSNIMSLYGDNSAQHSQQLAFGNFSQAQPQQNQSQQQFHHGFGQQPQQTAYQPQKQQPLQQQSQQLQQNQPYPQQQQQPRQLYQQQPQGGQYFAGGQSLSQYGPYPSSPNSNAAGSSGTGFPYATMATGSGGFGASSPAANQNNPWAGFSSAPAAPTGAPTSAAHTQNDPFASLGGFK